MMPPVVPLVMATEEGEQAPFLVQEVQTYQQLLGLAQEVMEGMMADCAQVVVYMVCLAKTELYLRRPYHLFRDILAVAVVVEAHEPVAAKLYI